MLFWIIFSIVIYLILFAVLLLFLFSLKKDVIDFSTAGDKLFLRCIRCRQEIIVDRERRMTGDGEAFAIECPICGGAMINEVLLWNHTVKGEAKENEDRD